MKEQLKQSMTVLCEAKSMDSFESDDKRRTVEMTALLTVIRENLVGGKTNYEYGALVAQSIDLTEPILHYSYLYERYKGSPIGSSIWSLIISKNLVLAPDRSLTCSYKLKKALLQTLPQLPPK